MNFDDIYNQLKTRFLGIDAPAVEAGDRYCVLPVEQAHEILRFLKDDPAMRFDSLMSLAGADTGTELWVVYPLHSMSHFHKITCKVVLPRENPACDSVVDLWMVANFFEREAYDLYGITFRNHPDLRRIINPQDWVGWPGRKDYVFPAEYNGIETARDDQYFQPEIDKAIDAREAREKEMLASIAALEKK